MKRVELQVEQLIEQMQRQDKRKFPSQTEQAKAIIVIQSGKVINNELS